MAIRPWFFIFVISLLSATPGIGQYYLPVFPNLEGQILIDSLKAHFKPQTVLDYGTARDTLYSKIYLEKDSVFCAYSRHSLLLPPGADPTTTLFMNGVANGINCEHTYPQSKGAEFGNAKSDMHHLFPNRAAVNGARSNLPFGEVPDTQTEKWYFQSQALSTIPTVGIDGYSERGADKFEPREDHKGNTARAVFYFYTMYQSEADIADPAFFILQRDILCQWQYLDLVDSLEWVRTWKIATYQDGKPNPFVLDCTLAARTWCEDLPFQCSPILGVHEAKRVSSLTVFPNPTSEKVNLKMTLSTGGTVQVLIFDQFGREVEKLNPEFFQAGDYDLEVPFSLTPGLYFIHLSVPEARQNLMAKVFVF